MNDPRDEVPNERWAGRLRAAEYLFLGTWTFAMLFWIFADVRMAFRNADPNQPIADGFFGITLFGAGLLTLVVCAITMVLFLWIRRRSKQ